MGSDIFEKIDIHLQNHRMGTWTGTLRDYLGMVMKQPSLAQRAHARLYNMIKRTGVQVDDEGKDYAFSEAYRKCKRYCATTLAGVHPRSRPAYGERNLPATDPHRTCWAARGPGLAADQGVALSVSDRR